MGLIFNEDPNHFVYTRAQSGITALSEKDLTDFIDGYADTNITDFLICVNASLPHFKTKILSPSAINIRRGSGLAGSPAEKTILS